MVIYSSQGGIPMKMEEHKEEEEKNRERREEKKWTEKYIPQKCTLLEWRWRRRRGGSGISQKYVFYKEKEEKKLNKMRLFLNCFYFLCHINL